MFHVEHIKILFLALFFGLFLNSCTSADPNPELKDPIYQDIKIQMGLAEKSLAEADKKLAEFSGELSIAIPQTGQFKQAQKKVFQAERERETFRQQVKYWTIRSEERAKKARVDYSRSLKDKTPWPNPKEFESYLSEKKLRLAKIEWDSKQRLENYKKELGGADKGASRGEPASTSSGH